MWVSTGVSTKNCQWEWIVEHGVSIALVGLLLSAVAGEVSAQQPSKEQAEEFRRLFKTEPVPCAHDRKCICARFTATTNLPMAYSVAQHCPAEPGSGTFPGTARVTNLDDRGNRISAGLMVEGAPHGLWRGWHPSGKRASEVTYDNGVEVGAFSEWHENGVVAKSGSHINGKPHGTWIYRDRAGQIRKQLEFQDGKLMSKKEFN